MAARWGIRVATAAAGLTAACSAPTKYVARVASVASSTISCHLSAASSCATLMPLVLHTTRMSQLLLLLLRHRCYYRYVLQLSHQARRTTRLRRATPTLATLTNTAGTTTTAIAAVAFVVELAVESSRPLLSHSHSLLRTTTTAHKLLHLTVYYHARTCIHPHTHTHAHVH